ncbi:MAG: inositol monophosphatase [candidate division Zixibacteria bacterium]|nr:inositol monophosphatase [candidate division Zixibacteria bacterium]
MKVNRALSAALLQAATEAAHQAGRLLLANVQKNRKVQLKGRIDLVTEMDLRSETLIVAHLRRAFPESSFLTEEGSVREEAAEVKWIVDPLDGTTNYAHTFPVWCVSIAAECNGELVAGCIYDPTRDEMFTATKHDVARLNRGPIAVSDRRRLDQALLATGFPYDIRTSRINNLVNFTNFVKTARAVRRAGSAALDLCYLACGRFDGYWELKLHPWDMAAGVLIVRQAGGRISDFDGNEFSIYKDRLLGSNGRIHKEMMRVLAAGK